MSTVKSKNPYDESYGPQATGAAPLAIPMTTRGNSTPAPIGMQRATINVDPTQWRQFRSLATLRGVTASDLIRDFIAATLREGDRG